MLGTNDAEAPKTVQQERLKSILESLLFAAGEPVSLAQLANALDSVPREQIRQALIELASAYAGSSRGMVLEEIAGGYQLRTPKEHALYVRRLLAAKPPRLSRPLLETLAIVGYRQPITRPEIEQLRGVDSGGVLETLLERGLVKLAGRKEAPGRPIIYATTPVFLELFGLKDLESLPDLEEFRELEGLRERPRAKQEPAVTGPLENTGSQLPAQPEPPAQGMPAELSGGWLTDQTAPTAPQPSELAEIAPQLESRGEAGNAPASSVDAEPEDSD